MITTAGLAKITGFKSSDCSNFLHGRENFVREDRRRIMETVKQMSQCDLIEKHLEEGSSISPYVSLYLYGVIALSQRVREINLRYERDGRKRRIVNIADKGAGKHGIYELETW